MRLNWRTADVLFRRFIENFYQPELERILKNTNGCQFSTVEAATAPPRTGKGLYCCTFEAYLEDLCKLAPIILKVPDNLV